MMQEVQQSAQIVNATVDMLLASYGASSQQLAAALPGKALTVPLETVAGRLESLKDMLIKELGDMGATFPGGWWLELSHNSCLKLPSKMCMEPVQMPAGSSRQPCARLSTMLLAAAPAVAAGALLESTASFIRTQADATVGQLERLTADVLAAYPQLNPEVRAWWLERLDAGCTLIVWHLAQACHRHRGVSTTEPWTSRLLHPKVFINNVKASLEELLGAVDNALKDFHVLVPEQKLQALKEEAEVTAASAVMLGCWLRP